MNIRRLSEERELRPLRRAALFEKIKHEHPNKHGILLLCASFERDRVKFYQDSSFHYFVGIDEPAVIFTQSTSGTTCLYEPRYEIDRSIWLPSNKSEKLLKEVGIETFSFLGGFLRGYEASPFFSKEAVEILAKNISEIIADGGYVFTPLVDTMLECQVVIKQLCFAISGLQDRLIDIAPLIGLIRRKKDMRELEHIYRAIEITAAAQEAALETIEPDVYESLVEAAINYIFTQGQAISAFSSIVGSGKNSTILHYIDNHDIMKAGDLVVVDIGASYQHYAADVTRTYPVSGTFTNRQKEVYELVIAAQAAVAQMAKPGMFLNNPNEPDKSLHHRAVAFFQKHGVVDYFPHGIGHFVGLDVHDVGNRSQMLEEGDVITIEPGLYFPREGLGVRIEDMYWIIEGGNVCLTEGIVKDLNQIEKMMEAILEEVVDDDQIH